MNKTQIIEKVAEGNKISKTMVARVINRALSVIQESLSRNEKVTIRGFGTFYMVLRGAREYRNPRTGERVKVPAKWVLRFRASK